MTSLQTELEHLARTLYEKARGIEAHIAFAESCTGGLLAHALTSIPGASKVFFGAEIVYDNRAKVALGVSETTLEKKGAVSSEVASELSRCLSHKIRKSLAHGHGLITLSTTGVAGPEGGTATKPVGLCYSATTFDLPGKLPLTLILEIRGPADAPRSELQHFFARRALQNVLEHFPER